MDSFADVFAKAAKTSPFLSICIGVILILTACKLVHLALRHLGQPRIISEFIVGFLIGNVPYLRKLVQGPLEHGFQLMEGFSSALYMFVLGLEMDLVAILRPPGPEAKIAFAGIASTCSVYVMIIATSNPKTRAEYFKNFGAENLRVLASFLIMFSATSSPIVTRLITELKLGQTQIGRHAIGAGLANDLICTLCMCFLISLGQSPMEVGGIALGVIVETVVAIFVMRILFGWVNGRNPEGKPFKGLDMTIIVVATQFLCHSARFFNYDTKVNSFLIGLALPRQGRVSNFLISKINYILTSFILPLYLSMAGIKANFRAEEEGNTMTKWAKMAVITVLATVSKTLGTLILSMRHGLHWLEAITLGVILSMKGYYQIFFSMHAKNRKLMSDSEFIVMVLMVVVSIIFVPIIVSFIVRKVRKIKEGNAKLMGLQWYNPKSQLRINIGLQGLQSVTAAMNLMETMARGCEEGLILHATDMIELNEHNKAALIYRQGIMVADDAVIELREQIGKSLDAHMQSSTSAGGKGNITLRRNLAISSFSNMHDDICGTAQDNMAMLIVLPFHKSQKPDGEMDAGHSGFRTVNKNVLQHAPCSVGILIDRGLGQIDDDPSGTSSTTALAHVAVLFIGGTDDREALACASIIAQNPTIQLLTIRIVADVEAMAADGPGRRVIAMMPNREIEMRVDDEYFAGFYEHYIMKGRVEYLEKHVKNGAEALQVLRELDSKYQLFIIGQGGDRNSVLTEGLSEWAECPELGPIGDILVSSDFPLKPSVLVIQQHNPARNIQYISDEFM